MKVYLIIRKDEFEKESYKGLEDYEGLEFVAKDCYNREYAILPVNVRERNVGVHEDTGDRYLKNDFVSMDSVKGKLKVFRRRDESMRMIVRGSKIEIASICIKKGVSKRMVKASVYITQEEALKEINHECGFALAIANVYDK